jgi:Fe2+ or Zn2+ uptake regulation protein
MAARLPKHARALLTILAEATTPLRREEVLRTLQERVPLRTCSCGYHLLRCLRTAGLIRFAERSMAETETVLANIMRHVGTLGDDDAPEISSPSRYEVTESGHAYLRRRVR